MDMGDINIKARTIPDTEKMLVGESARPIREFITWIDREHHSNTTGNIDRSNTILIYPMMPTAKSLY